MTKANAAATAAILIINGLAAVGTTIAAFRFDSQTLHGYVGALLLTTGRSTRVCLCTFMYCSYIPLCTILAARCRDRVMFYFFFYKTIQRKSSTHQEQDCVFVF